MDFDRELLRRFYLAHGYADFDVDDIVNSELSPDRKEFFVTFQINEGVRYRIGKVTVEEPRCRKVMDAQRYRPASCASAGRRLSTMVG